MVMNGGGQRGEFEVFVRLVRLGDIAGAEDHARRNGLQLGRIGAEWHGHSGIAGHGAGEAVNG